MYEDLNNSLLTIHDKTMTLHFCQSLCRNSVNLIMLGIVKINEKWKEYEGGNMKCSLIL